VNEEILHFRRLGRNDRILAMIVAGEPNAGDRGDAARECFPKALKHKLGADGNLLSEVSEPIAADARPEAGGMEVAALKLIAGVLGVGYEALKQRELEAQRRRVLVYRSVIACLALLTLAATGGGLLSYYYMLRSQAMAESAVVVASGFLEQEIKLSRQMGVTQHTIESVLTVSEGQMDELYKRGVTTPGLQFERASSFYMFAEHYGTIGDTTREHSRAVQALSLLLDLVARYPKNIAYGRNLALAKEKLGETLTARGELNGAVESLRSSLTIVQDLMSRYPDAATMQRDEVGALLPRDAAMAECAIGDVLWAQGNVLPALESYFACLKRLHGLVQSNPGHVGWQYELAVSNVKVGDVFMSQGELQRARETYQLSLETLQHLVALEPDDTLWQRDLAVHYIKVGDALLAARQVPSAEHSYEMGLMYAQRLASSDPGNTKWQSDLSVAYRKMGSVCDAQGQLERAAIFCRDGLEIAAHLAARDPHNEGWQHEAVLSHDRYGDTWLARGKPDDALEQYKAGLAIAQRLVASNPDNLNWQDDLGLTYLGLSNVERKRGDATAADSYVLQASTIYQKLVQKAPANRMWTFHRDLAETIVQTRHLAPR
jgi:tetratricopeptide (TPR) repeat protein